MLWHGALLAACAAITIGCAGPRAPGASGGTPEPPTNDAPYELADDGDLSALRARFRALPLDAERRPALRARLAREYDRRIRKALAGERRTDAYAAFTSLLGLWHPRELDKGPAQQALARRRGALRRVRDTFARSGGDREAVAALYALAAADPARADAYLSEIDEVFAFADELAVAAHGEGAERSRPIEILEHVVTVFPSRRVVDRLTSLYVERQHAVATRFQDGGADLRLIRAHGHGVMRTTWNIVRAHAHAMRLSDAPAALREASDFGDDDDLRAALAAALAADATGKDWVVLASAFRGDGEDADRRAALRICELAALERPRDPRVHTCAADIARALEKVPLSVRHYERALELAPERRGATESLAELYAYQIGQLAFDARPGAARRVLETFARLSGRAHELWPDKPLEIGIAAAHAAMGRGLVSLGRLDEARDHLERSLDERATHGALEYLGTIALRQDRFDAAVELFERALAIPASSPSQTLNKARILRLTGEAHAGAGEPARAEQRFRDALAQWESLSAELGELAPAYQAELLVESGKLAWHLGRHDEALGAFQEATHANPDGASTHADVVAFLIVRDEYDRAVDVYHHALGTPAVGDYFKIYMSLWVVAEARRTGRSPDPLAERYLAERSGRLWHDDLARYASGRLELPALERSATTRGRRAELLYYRAVLEEVPADLARARALMREVLKTDMVLFFEYEMAKHWLSRGLDAPGSAAGGRRVGAPEARLLD